MDYGYYDNKLKRSEGIYRICFVCAAIIIGLIISAVLSGCRTKKSLTEKTDTQDSVRIEYREKVVKVPVTVYVEVPVEVKEKFSPDSISHLETSFAVSDAKMIWIDGVAFLRHSLQNKAQKIQKNDSVPVVEKETIQWKTRRVTYTKTITLEKQLSWWDKTLIYCGYAFFTMVMVSLIYLCVKLFVRRYTLRR